ncbi:AAA family ATPase [Allochromatium humboldtianum]|uniref:AAA family ATPase n=1 Tax=Allochromatium humboldtianum TaxID=504901 RepID=A0A850RCS6_9GAMM|nr:AAA domain-containing protein [Allochromatium humboldtianum]NVZ09042.1 AAA family ATPase [Allochromatium humboldtianum]
MTLEHLVKKQTARDRLTQTFKFLKGLNELRNPVPRDLSGLDVLRLDQWPIHPCIQIWRGDRDEDAESETAAELEPVIRIRRPHLTPCPTPPRILESWLIPGWQSVDAPVEVLPSRNSQTSEGHTVTIDFSHEAERLKALDVWKAERAKWVTAERPSIAAYQIFERIHALWTTMQREGDRLELILAEGMLSVPEHGVQHPVLMQRVTLTFDPSVPEFHFSSETEKVELHRALLRLLPDLDGAMIGHFEKELDERPVDPLGGDSTTGFLRRLIHGLLNGDFLDTKPQSAKIARPSLWREPVIILRSRIAGLTTTLDHIVEHLDREETAIPEGLARIVGVELSEVPSDQSGQTLAPSPMPSEPAPDILFSKPANGEQYAIADRLMKTRAILVQGPPGTGKTHTIANLLGHLLAHGKSVLVTAHTTKALRVLRQQVDESIQALALSVLEGDADSQAQLARAAQQIVDRLSNSDAADLRAKAKALRQRRRKLLEETESLRRQLRAARFSEVDEIVLGGEGIAPIEAAKQIKANADRDSWIPGPLTSGALCPLTETEIRQLYASQTLVSPVDEAQLAVRQPDLKRLVSTADFHQLAQERTAAGSRARSHRPDLWEKDTATRAGVEQLQRLHQRVTRSAETLFESTGWLREVIFAGWMGGDWRETWIDLLNIMEMLADEAGSAQKLILAHGPELPADHPPDETLRILKEILDFLEAGREFGLKTKLTRRAWHRLIEDCRVDGRVPQVIDEFRALYAMARLAESRRRFVSRWQRTVESLGGPMAESLGHRPELTAQGYAQEIRKRLDWRQSVWEPLIDELRSVGFRWDAWLANHAPLPGDQDELARIRRAGSSGLSEIVEAQAALIRQSELSAALQTQRGYLAGFPQSKPASTLLRAQDAWNVDNYDATYRDLTRLEGLREIYETRLTHLRKLEPIAQAWAQAIAQRQPPHESSSPPGEVAAAWRWRQLTQELDRRAQVSLTDLQSRLDRTEEELRKLAAEIIEHESWAAQCERVGLPEQQALTGYVQTMRRIGKGTGRRAPALLREARKLLASARHAVPVWIMPLNRVYESFDPRETRFDVVIIDEASQSDVTALAALYLGREYVIVGDKEQVTPDAVGQKFEDVKRIIDTDLQDIPHRHLFDGQTSIYDLAEMSFGGVLALREHFRCVPEIIQFSNQLSYGNAIRPLREPLSARICPALISHRVDGYRDKNGKTNPVEAEEIASLIVAFIQHAEFAYDDTGQPTSIGVVSLLGDDQALLIEELLRSRLAPDVFAKHRLLCGNAAQFQGDERDVIFLSLVDGPPDDGKLPLRDTGPRDIYKKRYNVAVSRARDQLWVVHSIDPESHLKSGDLRRRLIEHARDPRALMRELEEQGQRTESVFEQRVLERLVTRGYRVKTQWPVGAYRIDLVVEGTTKRLAVECDGERWHTQDQLQRDLERQAILERLGWIFVRIRGSLFFRDPDAAMEPVFARLDQLGIEQLGVDTERRFEESSEKSPHIEQIKRHAQSLRAEWSKEKEATESQEVVVETERFENPQESQQSMHLTL